MKLLFKVRIHIYIWSVYSIFQCGGVIAQTTGDTLSCGRLFCCCNADPTPAGVMISHIHEKKQWMLSYRYMNMGMNGILSGVNKTDKNDVFVNYLMAPETMRMDMHMLMGMYGLTDRITLMAMFNYNLISMQMSMFAAGGHHHGGTGTSTEHSMKTSGIGDSKLYALYGLINKPRHQVIICAGISLPTGSIQMKGNNDDPMYPNQRLPYSMQMGSGSYDVLPCVNYLFQKNKLTFSTQVSGVARLNTNSVGYKSGNEINGNVWLAYEWFRFFSSSVRFEANRAGVMTGNDPILYSYNEPSANPYNYGGERMNVYIGSSYQFQRGILKKNRLAAEYGIPLYQNLRGIQMPQTHTLTASWTMMF